MVFTSFTYFLFLLLAVPLVWATRGVWRERVLLVASFVFYAAWDVRFVPVLVGLGALTYVAGRRIARARVAALKRPALVAWPIVAILLVLGIFKYSAWVVESVNGLLGASLQLPVPSVLLPLGISFYTFECISYLLDVYKGTAELRPFRRFLLFPAFWPHLVAGPILRIKEFGPQLESMSRPPGRELLAGFDRVLIGMCKKVVLADNLAGIVDATFASAAGNSSVDNWLGAIAFGLQIYFDFSAYSDIAIGCARMVGIRFPENFDLPYHASSPSEFWNRWHMTLSRWIRDYVFFPLNMRAGRRTWLRYAYLVLVMTLVGLWHGAGAGFVLWGTWHGLLMVGHRVLQTRTTMLPPTVARALRVLGRLASLALITAGWVLFRAPTLGEAGAMLKSMLTLSRFTPVFSVNDYLLVLFCVGVYFLLSPLEKRFVSRDPSGVDYGRWMFYLRPLAYANSIQLLFMFDRSNVGFIYFQF